MKSVWKSIGDFWILTGRLAKDKSKTKKETANLPFHSFGFYLFIIFWLERKGKVVARRWRENPKGNKEIWESREMSLENEGYTVITGEPAIV